MACTDWATNGGCVDEDGNHTFLCSSMTTTELHAFGDGSGDQSVLTSGFVTKADLRGGLWVWDASKNKATANLGTVIDTTRALTIAGQGTGFGVGCWVREYAQAVFMRWFCVGDGVADDSTGVAAAIASDSKIDTSGGTYKYTSSTTITASDKQIVGNGTIQVSSGTGFSLTGDNNKISDAIVKAPTKSVSASMNYTNWGIEIDGDNNTIDSVEVYNIDGSGIVLRGTNNKIINSYLHDNITGLRTYADSRDVLINNNTLKNNDVNDDSGACGVLLHRSTMRVNVTNNEISGNGEHGLYGQGQDYYIAGNRVFDNAKTGLKFGSYETNLVFNVGETQDDYEWVVDSHNVNGGGVDETYYGMQHIIITGNECWDNGGDDGIYFQPSARNVVISNNIVNNNDIRFIYFDYTGVDARLEDFYHITIENNYVDNGKITIAGNNKLRALNNRVTAGVRSLSGKISTSAPDATTEPRLDSDSHDSEIRDNHTSLMDVARAKRINLMQNIITDQLYVSTNTEDVRLFGNRFVLENLGASGVGSGPLDTARVSEMVGNYVVVNGDIPFNSAAFSYSFPKLFIDNTIIGNDFDSTGAEAFISANDNIPNFGRFCDNHIECTSALYAVKFEGAWCVMNGNVILASTIAVDAIDNHGNRMNISNNIVRYGDIRNRNDNDHVIIGNIVGGGTVTNDLTGTGNIIHLNEFLGIQNGQNTLSSGTVAVTLAVPMETATYTIVMSGNANETFYWSARATTGFTINSSNGSSTASVNWEVKDY